MFGFAGTVGFGAGKAGFIPVGAGCVEGGLVTDEGWPVPIGLLLVITFGVGRAPVAAGEVTIFVCGAGGFAPGSAGAGSFSVMFPLITDGLELEGLGKVGFASGAITIVVSGVVASLPGGPGIGNCSL